MNNKSTTPDKNNKEIERIIEVLVFFSKQRSTFLDWLNETQKNKDDEEMFFNILLSSGFLLIPHVNYSLSYISLYNDYSDKILFVTKDGYSLINSYYFNKQSLKINEEVLEVSKHVKLISITAIVISLISLVITLVY